MSGQKIRPYWLLINLYEFFVFKKIGNIVSVANRIMYSKEFGINICSIQSSVNTYQ